MFFMGNLPLTGNIDGLLSRESSPVAQLVHQLALDPQWTLMRRARMSSIAVDTLSKVGQTPMFLMTQGTNGTSRFGPALLPLMTEFGAPGTLHGIGHLHFVVTTEHVHCQGKNSKIERDEGTRLFASIVGHCLLGHVPNRVHFRDRLPDRIFQLRWVFIIGDVSDESNHSA